MSHENAHEGEVTRVRHLPEVAACRDRFRAACVRYWAVRNPSTMTPDAVVAERMESARRAFAAGLSPAELEAIDAEVRR